jgi:hypothetical protein
MLILTIVVSVSMLISHRILDRTYIGNTFEIVFSRSENVFSDVVSIPMFCLIERAERMKSNNDVDFSENNSKIVDEITSKIVEYSKSHPIKNVSLLNSLISTVIDSEDLLIAGTSDISNLMEIGEIEGLIHDSLIGISGKANELLRQNLRNMGINDPLAKQKKNEYQKKGIKIITRRFTETTINTINGPIIIGRKSLVISPSQDIKNLPDSIINKAIYPLDDALGISVLPYTYTVAAMLEAAKTAIDSVSFEHAEQTLRNRNNITIGDDTLRKVTNLIGNIAYQNDLKLADDNFNKLNSGILTFPQNKIDGTLFLQTDGSFVPIRTDNKSGKEYKECKLGMAFLSTDFKKWTDKRGEKQKSIQNEIFTAYVGGFEQFGKLFFSLALTKGYGKFKNTVLIADGAQWIKTIKDSYFPDSTQILDFFHLKEHIIDYAKIRFGEEQAKYKSWVDKICDVLKNSEIDKALEIINQSMQEESKEALNSLTKYISNNREIMDYLTYTNMDYFIGSGAIESGNKVVIKERMKRGAMRWSLKSAQGVATLLAKRFGGQWESDVENPVIANYR